MRCCNSYQNILTPEEEEERDRRIWARQRYEEEKAEYLAECREDEEGFEED